MIGRFLTKDSVRREKLSWGELAWYSSPQDGGLKQLVVIEVTLLPGCGHAFHCHPTQEEVIYCLKGEVEQWIGEEKAVLREGDAVIIPAGGVHASLNRGDKEAVLLAIIGPAAATESGYSVEELAEQEPWRTLWTRQTT
jgi:quercetin dioxygenase-like cupin family protein